VFAKFIPLKIRDIRRRL